MSESVNFPPGIVTYLKQEIEVRNSYKRQLESLSPGIKMIHKARYKVDKDRLEANIVRLTDAIIAITKKHFPSIDIDENPEVTITNILKVLPNPEKITPVRQVSARGSI